MAYKHRFLSKKTVAILDTIPFGIYFCDAAAIVRYINKPYADYIGADPKDIIGKQITDFIPRSRAREVIESGKEEMYDRVSVFQEKKQTILVNRIPVTNEKGETEGFISQLFSVGKGEWQGVWEKIEQAEKTVQYLQQESGEVFSVRSEAIIGNSPALLRCMEKLTSYARSDLPVLITGGTGVGKELFANTIHRKSRYGNGPIISINCGSLPAELIESELFGYAPGAFTNAVRFGKKGRIELADKGTLFLDELGDLPLRAQASLLRVLETREVQRIGSNKLHQVKFRLVAATNQDLEAKIRLGQFREDFYYRVNILRLRAPSLCERVEDIPDLSKHFLGIIGKDHVVISDEAMHILKRYSWPGNIRELRNVVVSAAISCKNNMITPDVLPDNLFKSPPDPLSSPDSWPSGDNFSSSGHIVHNKHVPGSGTLPDATLAARERDAILEALRANQNNRARTARALGIARTTLYKKLKKYSILSEITK
jgi:transcriptional regulator with PAS, ATPase and Fis domain